MNIDFQTKSDNGKKTTGEWQNSLKKWWMTDDAKKGAFGGAGGKKANILWVFFTPPCPYWTSCVRKEIFGGNLKSQNWVASAERDLTTSLAWQDDERSAETFLLARTHTYFLISVFFQVLPFLWYIATCGISHRQTVVSQGHFCPHPSTFLCPLKIYVMTGK